MRLAPIIPINTADIAIAGEGIEGRDERLARRAGRQKKRARETAARSRARSGKRARKKPRSAQAAPPAAPPTGPSRAPGRFRPGMMRRPPEADLYDDEEHWEDEDEEVYDDGGEDSSADDAFYDDEDLEDFEGEVLAGARRVLGRSLPDQDARRVWEQLKAKVRRGREEVRSRRAQRGQRRAHVQLPAPPASPRQAATAHDNPVWGPVVKMGPNIAAQARHGRRMAVLTLRPGLFIVADVPEAAIMPTLEGGFGLAPVLVPAIKAAAMTALKSPARQERVEARREARQNGDGLLKRIFSPSSPSHARPALPGPAEPAPLMLAGCCEWCDARDRL